MGVRSGLVGVAALVMAAGAAEAAWGQAGDGVWPIQQDAAALEEEMADYDPILILEPGPPRLLAGLQDGGVDEDGQVQALGDYLIIMREGRLHAISIADGRLQVSDSIAVLPPSLEPEENWRTGLLVVGSQIIVLGGGDDQGGPSVDRFQLTQDGKLSFRDAYIVGPAEGEHWTKFRLRNYRETVRLIDNQLVIHSAQSIKRSEDARNDLPGVRRVTDGAAGPFRPIARDAEIFEAIGTGEANTLHFVARCDPLSADFECKASVAVGPSANDPYFSTEAVYLWEIGVFGKSYTPTLYRMPLDGSRPGAVAVRGRPIGVAAYREDLEAGQIEVVVESSGNEDEEWRADFAEGRLALLRLPFERFGDGSSEARNSDYRLLPTFENAGGAEGMILGDKLVLSLAESESASKPAETLLVASADATPIQTISFPLGVIRLGAFGTDAIVLSGDELPIFSTVSLDRAPRVLDEYAAPREPEEEVIIRAMLSHVDHDVAGAGVLGLPMTREGQVDEHDNQRCEAEVRFIAVKSGQLSAAGRLKSQTDLSANEHHCSAWYHNAQPIFVGDRIFALIGYELVEGRIEDGVIREVGRVNFAPAPSPPPPAED